MNPLSEGGTMALSWLKLKHQPTRLFGPAEYLKAKIETEISPDELKLATDFDPATIYLIDVRERAAFEREHVRGAVTIPLAHLGEWIESLPRGKPLVAYGWDMTCKLALQAALEMTLAGYPARVLAGGIDEWKRKGFPVEKGASAPPPAA
jgi:rhodanese-related sulfurtransferase